jgi:hypothetical protein
MKAVPILVVTNALALGLVVVLFVQQGDLESQLNATRTPTARHTDVVEEGAVEDRIARLERLLKATGGGADVGFDLPEGPGPGGEPAMAADGPAAGGEAEAGAEAGVESGGAYDPQEMERFRKKVRRAIELNGQEDRVTRVVDRLDGLISENKIAPLTPKQKTSVAETILAAQQKIPEVFRRLRESGSFNDVPREERRQLVRAEIDSLRGETQKELESTVPAADAKTIMDDYLSDMFRGPGRGGFGRPPGGGRTSGRGPPPGALSGPPPPAGHLRRQLPAGPPGGAPAGTPSGNVRRHPPAAPPGSPGARPSPRPFGFRTSLLVSLVACPGGRANLRVSAAGNAGLPQTTPLPSLPPVPAGAAARARRALFYLVPLEMGLQADMIRPRRCG